MKLLKLNKVPIYEQLQIEEALLRADEENYCLINTNPPEAIVMGISGKLEKLVNTKLTTQDNVPIIKRFSGGGTVYIDPETIFVTFICNTKPLNIPAYPNDILNWSETFYRPLFPASFQLRENDFTLGEKKIGGNAQYIRNQRWLLHTSFLWNFTPQKMAYLLHPEKTPKYRNNRPHSDFLTPLSSHLPSKTSFLDSLLNHIHNTFSPFEISLPQISSILTRPHRKSTTHIQ